jgi:hypothetical protein
MARKMARVARLGLSVPQDKMITTWLFMGQFLSSILGWNVRVKTYRTVAVVITMFRVTQFAEGVAERYSDKRHASKTR